MNYYIVLRWDESSESWVMAHAGFGERPTNVIKEAKDAYPDDLLQVFQAIGNDNKSTPPALVRQ